MTEQQQLIVFAKTPKPGLAKTRLIPTVGAEGAAALAERLFKHTMQTVMPLSELSHTHLELCVTGPEDDSFFLNWAKQLSPDTQLTLTHQEGPNLGARMHHAMARALESKHRALLIGTDAPGLSAAMINEAFAALQEHDAVFVPAFDGGYALVGLHTPIAALFHDVNWGNAQVMQISRTRLRALGKTWLELAPVHDIDEPADLIHLPLDWLPEMSGT